MQDFSAPETLQSPFLRLPLELRLEIYRFSLEDTLDQIRIPNALAHAVYFENLRDVWTDEPLPLLMINQQIRMEVSIIMLHVPVSLRITGQGMAFDGLGLSALFAQEIHGDFGKIRHLSVWIWPPHDCRPADTLYIWNYLRKLRNTLKKYTRIQRLSLNFINNKVFHWTKNGKLLNDLLSRRSDGNDLTLLLDLFANLTNVTEAITAFPANMPTDREGNDLRRDAAKIRRIMQGLQAPARSPTFLENLDWDSLELNSKRRTAILAQRKLDRMSQWGGRKLLEGEYDDVVQRWPYFETLTRYEDRKFLGKWHYAERYPTVEGGIHDQASAVQLSKS